MKNRNNLLLSTFALFAFTDTKPRLSCDHLIATAQFAGTARAAAIELEDEDVADVLEQACKGSWSVAQLEHGLQKLLDSKLDQRRAQPLLFESDPAYV